MEAFWAGAAGGPGRRRPSLFRGLSSVSYGRAAASVRSRHGHTISGCADAFGCEWRFDPV
jgi:hypothetical protein